MFEVNRNLDLPHLIPTAVTVERFQPHTPDQPLKLFAQKFFGQQL